MTRLLGLLLVTVTLSLGSCQCSNKPDIGPVEEEESAHLTDMDRVTGTPAGVSLSTPSASV